MPLETIQCPSTGARAQILVERGFNCVSFSLPDPIAGPDGRWECLDTKPEFLAGGDRPSGNGIPLLFPFPNRIARGRFEWEGTVWTLPADQVGQDGLGNAIHGLCLDRPWRIQQRSSSRITGVFQLSIDAPELQNCWPGDFRLECTYSVAEQTLGCQFRITNPGQSALPWGLGTHAYFKLPLSPESSLADILLQAPSAYLWELNDLLPTGKLAAVPARADLREGLRFDGLRLDDVLRVEESDLAWDATIMDPVGGRQIVQRSHPMFRELVAFTPPNRDTVCLEPYTCVTNAINLGADRVRSGLQVLPAGETVDLAIEIFAGPILV